MELDTDLDMQEVGKLAERLAERAERAANVARRAGDDSQADTLDYVAKMAKNHARMVAIR